MQNNDAKYAKKIFLSFAKKMRNSCESDPVSHPFRIDAKIFFARPVHPSSKAGIIAINVSIEWDRGERDAIKCYRAGLHGYKRSCTVGEGTRNSSERWR